jgi:hypothetical protein
VRDHGREIAPSAIPADRYRVWVDSDLLAAREHPSGNCDGVIDTCRKWVLWSETVVDREDRDRSQACERTTDLVVGLDGSEYEPASV